MSKVGLCLCMCVCVCVCVVSLAVIRVRFFVYSGRAKVRFLSLSEAERLGSNCNTALTEGLTIGDATGTQGAENLRRI